MLSEAQQKELNDLRHDSQMLKEKLKNIEVDLDNSKYEIMYLNKWKSGRWIGFAIMSVITAIGFYVEYFYVVVQGNSAATRLSSKAAAIEFAVSSTVITFFTLLLAAISIFTIVIGIKMTLELSSSKGTRMLARNMGIKNYYNSAEYHIYKENALLREKFEMQGKKREADRRIAELEKDEEPWYQ